MRLLIPRDLLNDPFAVLFGSRRGCADRNPGDSQRLPNNQDHRIEIHHRTTSNVFGIREWIISLNGRRIDSRMGRSDAIRVARDRLQEIGGGEVRIFEPETDRLIAREVVAGSEKDLR